jgi:hypothetical protein
MLRERGKSKIGVVDGTAAVAKRKGAGIASLSIPASPF